jgi:hypothetical protein
MNFKNFGKFIKKIDSLKKAKMRILMLKVLEEKIIDYQRSGKISLKEIEVIRIKVNKKIVKIKFIKVKNNLIQKKCLKNQMKFHRRSITVRRI